MNKKIFEKLVKAPPADQRQKYIFVNDNRGICEAIATVGFRSVYIARKDSEAYFSAESFCEYIRDIANTGTCTMEYTFVLGCYYKRANDQIHEVLKNNLISCLTGGYLLFKDKEYLGNYEKQDELAAALDKYIKRFEGGDVGPVDPLQFCKLNEDGVPRGLLDIAIVRYLMDRYRMFVMGGELYIYRDGCYYIDEGGVRIKAEIQAIIPEQFITYRTLCSLYNLLLGQAELRRNMDQINQYPAHWINFRNGMFDVKEMKLRKHRPEYYAINQIPHELDMELRKNLEAAGRETTRFLDESVPDSADRLMLWQYLGYTMTRDTCLQKMMIIKGKPGTGKSRLISLFQHIIGTDNYSSISLKNLNERFYPSMLMGKLMNACADIASTAMMTIDNVKKATGEDVMIYERKGKDISSFKSYAKLLFSANKIPLNLDEKSYAFYRRLLVLEINKTPANKDLDLDSKLHAEAGYSIWMAIAALKKMYEDGEITESPNSRLLVEELYREADSVKAFMDECTERREGSRINRTLLYDKYKEYCDGWGRKPLSKQSLYKQLAELGYSDGRTNKERYIVGIDFQSDGFLTDEDGEGKKVFGGRQ